MNKEMRTSGRKKFSGGKHISIDPELISLMSLVGAERYAEVESAARRILGKRPNQPLAMKALSFALLGLDRFSEVLPILEIAIRYSPLDPELHNNQGIALSMLMRWEDSIVSFRKAQSMTPNDPVLLKNMGAALIRMHQWDEAIPILLEAIQKHPDDYVEAILLLASALTNAHRHDEAWVCLQEIHKNDDSNLPAFFRLLSCALRLCKWDGLLDQIEVLRIKSESFSMFLDNPWSALPFPGLKNADHRRVAEAYSRGVLPSNEQVSAHDLTAAHSGGVKQRLRVAYISGDFREHAVGFVIPEVIELHDRSRFEVLAYSTKGDYGSDMRRRLMAAFDEFVDVENSSVQQVADRIRGDNVDILVDLAGWTGYGRPESLALRCAPIQVNWLGYAGTMGHPSVADYILGDSIVTPIEHATCYNEAIAQMPHCYMPSDTTQPCAEIPFKHAIGLPEGVFVFCSFNNSYKYNPSVFDLWSELLRAAPDSILWLSYPGESAVTALRSEVKKRGVEFDRLVFAHKINARADHLARLQLADLALDPFPYNSHSTGIDTLWAGVPMVTLKGDTFAGRVGASMLSAVGLEELIATTNDEYIDIALGLYRNPQKLAFLRQRLFDGRKSSALFDMKSFVNNLEQLYSRMWFDFVAGKRESVTLCNRQSITSP